MLTVDRCNLCGDHDARLVEVYHAADEGFEFVQCTRCGLSYVHNSPAPDEIGHYCESFPHPSYTQSRLSAAAFGIIRCCIEQRYGQARPARYMFSRMAEPLWHPR